MRCLHAQYWLKFSPVLDTRKAWKNRISGTEPDERLNELDAEERQAAEKIIDEERSRRSHIVTKYLYGMQVRCQPSGLLQRP